MGISCSTGKSPNKESKEKDFEITKNTISALISPFRLTRDDAEKLLVAAKCGSYVLSHDFTEERFISVSLGNFVCHHAISVREGKCVVDGEQFETIHDALNYYQTNPLGTVCLTHQFNEENTDPDISSTRDETSRKKSRKISFKNFTHHHSEKKVSTKKLSKD